MFIISNNCVGARIYNQLNIPFNNPFMWCSIKLLDFVELIKKYDEMDWKNIILQFEMNQFGREKCSKLLLMNNISIYFSHHLFDANRLSPIKIGDDIYYNDILEYIKEKWVHRVNLMPKEKPVFIYEDYDISPSHLYTNGDLEKYFNLSQKKILITTNTKLKDYENDNFKVFIKPKGIVDTKIIADKIIECNGLKKFIETS